MVFLPAARVELIVAQDWYEKESPGLGAQFRAEVDFQIGRIAANPLLFPFVLTDVRRARLRRFPYGLAVTGLAVPRTKKDARGRPFRLLEQPGRETSRAWAWRGR